MMPFGNLLAGTLAQTISAPSALIVCGTASMLGGVWFSAQISQVTHWIKEGPSMPSSLGS